MLRKKIALLTYKEHPHLVDGEKLLIPAFTHAGYIVEEVPWDGDADWKKYDTVILRTCWNYHQKRDAFLSWLADRERDGITIWNPPEIIRWNTDKHYLSDLQKSGVKQLKTVFLEPGDTKNITRVMEDEGWTEAIVKPAIGASAYNLEKVTRQTASTVDAKLDKRVSWLVQQYFPKISEGEYSLLFYGRNYSHAVLKKPKTNEFRTQPEFGGTESAVGIPQAIINQAKHILDVIDGPLLYARVDGIVDRNKFLLMELELSEPYLFFERHPQAAKRFVAAYRLLSR